jgi:hypothetical protein
MFEQTRNVANLLLQNGSALEDLEWQRALAIWVCAGN